MNFLEKYTACIDDVQLNKTTQSKVVLLQKGRRYCLINKSKNWQVTKFKVENCITNAAGEKGCEAILLAEMTGEAKGFYVELKGVSVGDAFKQIENSLNKTIVDLKNVVLFGRVVPSAYKRNKFLESYEQRLILKFRSLGGNFIVRENLEDEI